MCIHEGHLDSWDGTPFLCNSLMKGQGRFWDLPWGYSEVFTGIFNLQWIFHEDKGRIHLTIFW